MKTFLIIFLTQLLFSENSNSQFNDLYIFLKNGEILEINLNDVQSLTFENVTSVEDKKELISLAKNYPNPFTEITTIEFELEQSGTAEIIIYDNKGNYVNKLTCENCQVGKNSVTWNSLNFKNEKISDGLYFFELKHNGKSITKKMIKVN